MEIIVEGNVLEVVELLKQKMKNEIGNINLLDEHFGVDEVEIIQQNTNKYFELINGIYQDIIYENIKTNTKILVFENEKHELRYNLVVEGRLMEVGE